MSQEFHAIYENGILRPLAPLGLPEATEVVVTLQANPLPDQDSQSVELELQKQQTALDIMFAVVDKIPQSPPEDGLSGRDHDQILYGRLA